MTTDIVQLLHDHGIKAQTEGHKHCRPGWINMECPFCTGNPGLHLGASLDGKIFYCWRCGWHPSSKAVAKLLKIHEDVAKDLLKQYVGLTYITKEVKRKVRSKAHKYPSDTGPLEKRHKKYLENRGFDPDQLVQDWGLLGTGPVSLLDTLNYGNRILAPILWNDEEVTFQARDITGKHPYKYLACPEERELMKHKHILYGNQKKWTETALCVEGITDVWRLGFSAVCTFGIKYTSQQVRVLSQLFKRVPVIFDDDPQAVVQANALVADLCFRGIDSFRVPIVGDPGAMFQKEADYLVKQLMKKTNIFLIDK